MTELQKKGYEELKCYGEIEYECEDYFHVSIDQDYDENRIRAIGKQFFGDCEIVEEQYGFYDDEDCAYVWEFPLTEKGLKELRLGL